MSALVLGVVTVLLVGAVLISTQDNSASPERTPEPERTTPTPDTTMATEPLANVQCDDSFVVEIARSNPPYEKSSVENTLARVDGSRYLQADQSCSTYAAAGKRLIAYVGPFDDLAAACAARLKLNDAQAVPRRMNADQKGPNYCACSDPNPPTLRAGAGENGNVRVLLLVSEVQRMMKSLGYFAPAVVGDPYGPQTATAVRRFQFSVGLPATGTVNTRTWAALKQGRAPDGARFC
jgi:hypothetical protein